MPADPSEFGQWNYSGYIEIERSNGEEPMRYPFNFQSTDEMREGEIDALARQAAEGFLAMLLDTAPGHAGDYGEILDVTLTSVTFEAG